LSRFEVLLPTGLVEAIGVKSCWLPVLARPGFVEPSVFHPIPVKMMFPPTSPLLKVLMMSRKQHYVFQSPCFELKHSNNQKAYGFGYLADDTADKIN